ncbi:MAG: protein kinase [Myxococcaceae bacterium]|nr:protein kinase [Myxococcaceae bacterium]
MAFFICQACGTEYEAQEPKCPACGRSETIRLNRSDRMVDKVINGRYRIIRKLGQGGMGAVYLAEQAGIGHRVALKFLKSEFSNDAEIARRFLNEAKTYAKVVHPNAVTFHEFGQDDEGNLFIAMEYCEGVDLKKTIAERGRLSVVEAIEVVTQVADVLADAHTKQVVHRDLKPENIMIRKGLRGMHAKVLDFGIARLMDAHTKLTMQGAIAGTPRYMSPEQVEGREVDIRADIYALGIVCFEALTGQQPFDGATIAEIMRKQVTDPLPRLANYGPELDLPPLQAVLDKACAKRRDDRYPDMVAFASALSQAIPTQLHMSLPPLQRMATESTRASVARATPAPGEGTGVAVPGTLAGNEATESTMLQHPTVAPSATVTDGSSQAATQIPGVSSINPSASAPDTSLPPIAPRSKGPLIALALGLVALIVAGLVVLLGKPGPAPPPPVANTVEPKLPDLPKIPEPPKLPDDTSAVAAAATKLIHDQASLEKLKSAQTSWDKGDLNAAKIDLESVEADTPSRPDAEKLLEKLKQLQDAVAAGDALRRKGDCEGAMRSYATATKLNGNVEAVRRGIAECKAAAIPTGVE